MPSPLWRKPGVVIICGGIILMLSLGTRQSFGLFMPPMTIDLGWGREAFAFALSLQNIVWGLAQPFTGMIADRYGAVRVTMTAGALYTLGLVLMAHAETPLYLDLTAGVLIGLGLSGTAFGVVMGVIGRAYPPEKRSMALGLVGAGGSFGQFIMLPYGQALITSIGWYSALLVLAVSAFLIIPLSLALSGKSAAEPAPASNLDIASALKAAAGHSGFWLLSLAFLVCGFQTIFIMVHLPAYLMDQGLTARQGMMALALVGFFNVIGSYLCGLLGGKYSKKYLLSIIYWVRVVIIVAFISMPVSAASAYIFASIMGLTWLGTVPLTNDLVAQIFGVKCLSTLFSLTFLGHQIGCFLGAWYGGIMFDSTGSYNLVWIIAAALGALAAIACLPIDEREIAANGTSKQPA